MNLLNLKRGKEISRFLLFCWALYSTTILYAQANTTPCENAVDLAVGSSCTNVAGTLNGSSYSDDNDNFGTPSCGALNSARDVWYKFTPPTSGNVKITTSTGSITDGVMEVYESGCEGGGGNTYESIFCNDDGATSLMPSLTLTELDPNKTYFIRFWAKNGGNGTFNICIVDIGTINCTQGGYNQTCSTAAPFCTGNTYSYCNSINTIDAFNSTLPCSNVEADGSSNPDNLASSPNPVFYYLEIESPGDIHIHIEQKNYLDEGLDVDFAIWGPFTTVDNACTSISADNTASLADCSYSNDATEDVDLFGTTTGQIYMLLITNYSNDLGLFEFSKVGGSATSSCSILLPIELFDFNAREVEINRDKSIELSWGTAVESQNLNFKIEKSFDGIEFVEIGEVSVGYNIEHIRKYEFIDIQATFNRVSFYRLKQLDLNGDSSYSNIISSYIKNDELTIYPNPALDKIYLISGSFHPAYYRISDLYGNIWIKTKFNENQNIQEIDLTNLEQGTYFIELIDDNQLRVKINRFIHL
jgi:hypothetical protein